MQQRALVRLDRIRSIGLRFSAKYIFSHLKGTSRRSDLKCSRNVEPKSMKDVNPKVKLIQSF